MRNTKTDHDLRLIFTQSKHAWGGNSGTYHTLDGHFAVQTPDGLRYASSLEDINGLNLEGMEVHAQLDNRHATDPDGFGGFYGWSTNYREAHYVNLRKAESMVATLKKIERKLEALNERYGSPQTFGQYVARVCDVLGVKQVGLQKADKTDWANGERIRWMRPGDFVGQAAYIEQEIRKLYEPQEQGVTTNA